MRARQDRYRRYFVIGWIDSWPDTTWAYCYEVPSLTTFGRPGLSAQITSRLDTSDGICTSRDIGNNKKARRGLAFSELTYASA